MGTDDATEQTGSRAAGDRTIGGRYEIGEVLGRGGMAFVYRAEDLELGRIVALKQLALEPEAPHRMEIESSFRREFHVLAELAHPSVIKVYDFGLDDAGPFYTMELLDGADLREQCPLPWREACGLLHDVCSSLALVHSRRLVHRDVSPRNVRRTAEGRAKLIDFGAMVPMGRSASVVGTAPYVAPEVVHRSALDGRTDLFSLGATLYFALTRRLPYPARDFAELREIWKLRPLAPSTFAKDIPEALDALVLSLLNLEPASRPRTASEVMQRLASIAAIERAEPLAVSQAYLATPVMVGRHESMAVARAEMELAFGEHSRAVLIEGAAGLGRSRILDACALEAKTLGAVVARAAANAAPRENFGVARLIVEQLADAFSDDSVLASFTDPPLPRPTLHAALEGWILSRAETLPVAIMVDDFHQIDEPSAALLAVLASVPERHRLLVTATIERSPDTAVPAALQVFETRATKVRLEPLTLEQTESLFASLFGDVPNLRLVTEEVHAISGGNPRECMDVAQHMVDKGFILYEGGTWTLPSRLDMALLPASAEEAIEERLTSLSPLARWLAEAHALAPHETFTRAEYAALTDADADRVDQAVGELVAKEFLVSEGRFYAIARRSLASALTRPLSPEDRAERHRALAGVYPPGRGFTIVRHLFAGGLHERGLERLFELLDNAPMFGFFSGEADPEEMAPVFAQALEAAARFGRSKRDAHELRRWLVAVSVVSDETFYFDTAPAWVARLELDSGLADWKALGNTEDPALCLTQAMQSAFARYAASPPSERVYRPDEAIRLLALYVSVSIAIGVRTQNGPLLGSLPPLLAPFARISPLLEAIWENSIATCETVCHGKLEQARTRWIRVYERLRSAESSELERVDLVRRAVAYGVGAIESRLGFTSATTWADLLDEDPLQKVNALYLRKILMLHQGDWEGAERFRRQAESVALGAPRQMFTSSPIFELPAHGNACDLIGVKQILDRLEPLAARYKGYRGYRQLAQGLFEKLRGNLEDARDAFERAIELTTPDSEHPWRIVPGWPRAVAGLTETLVELGRSDEAKSIAEAALSRCHALGIGVLSHDIARALALAEAKLGAHHAAALRLDGVIEEQVRLGVIGMNLGVSYEARARIAIWAGDDSGVAEYARLTAREYRHGRGSPLGARYERLMDEARSAVSGTLPNLEDFESSRLSSTKVDGPASATAVVAEAMRGADSRKSRAERVLALLCDARGARAGHLYLLGSTGLELVASHETPDAPLESVGELVERYFQRLVAASASPSTTSAHGASTPGDSAIDATTVDFSPLLLLDLGGETPVVAGLTVFVDHDLRDPASPPERLLAAAVGAELIRRGDALGHCFFGPTPRPAPQVPLKQPPARSPGVGEM